MATYRSIATTETDPQAPLTSSLLKALEANPTAITEGASGAPRILDAALDTGAATTAGTTWVGLRTAGMNAGDVGSYAMLTFNTATAQGTGSTHAGSGLSYASAGGTTGSGGPSGTWRLMGRTTSTSGAPTTSLFLRIS